MFDLGDGFTLFRNRELTDEFVDFLETTAFGTQQNLYRHFYIREFVADTPDTEFYYARDAENELVAIVAFAGGLSLVHRLMRGCTSGITPPLQRSGEKTDRPAEPDRTGMAAGATTRPDHFLRVH